MSPEHDIAKLGVNNHRGRRVKSREKMLERELAKLAGENWQVRMLSSRRISYSEL